VFLWKVAPSFSLFTLNKRTMKGKVNEIGISYKERTDISASPIILSSSDAAELLFEYWDKNTITLNESFIILLLNNSNKVKGIYKMSIGGITGTLVDIRILFATVLKTLSTGIILAHNHPSGKLQASNSDIELTKKIKKAAKLFDVAVLDHLIITPNGDYYSFADNHII
jgi:DNA repair protein RadC